jgi:hypothetical protein
MPTETIDRNGIAWIEIGRAAKLCRTKATTIGEAIETGSIASHQEAGKTFIPQTAANRLKREAALMVRVKRMNQKRVLPPAHNYGVLSKGTQDVLPMSSGRGGVGWLGQKPKR